MTDTARIERVRGFAAIATPNARVLILGSLPGMLSIDRQQYYAKRENAFWKIMGALVGAHPELHYDARIRALTQSRIALWDVCESAQRLGSLDSAIRQHRPNDFASFFDLHPNIGLICFNGQKAAALYRRSVFAGLTPAQRELPSRTLPSTSPANAGVPYAQKVREWSAILYNA